MGKITILDYTTKTPIQMMGYHAGVCYKSNISDEQKNFKRGLECLESGHGRVMEFPDVYMNIEGYSARVIRELYTHIGGAPTRLQASTRYIDYQNGFNYIIPASLTIHPDAEEVYIGVMDTIADGLRTLEEFGVPKEDSALLLPLGMTTDITCKYNFRTLFDMSHQRMCMRAYWEYRELFEDIMNALMDYSYEWGILVENYFKPKCEFLNRCPEKKSCGYFEVNKQY